MEYIMAKFKKLISLIAVAIFCLTFLVGCGLFVLNQERYRAQEAMTVGTEVVTLGEIIDYFDNNGTQYVQQGQSVQSVWDNLFPAFVQQKVLISEYKLGFTGTKNQSELAKTYKNGEYFDDDMLVYIQKSVYVAFYQALDELTLQELSADFTFEEDDTTEKPSMIDRTESETGKNQWTPVDEDSYKDVKALDKALADYPAQDFKTVKYVFDENDERVKKIVADLVERQVKEEGDEDITVADYIEAQKAAVNQTTKNIKNKKSMSMDEYFVYAIEEQILSELFYAQLYKMSGEYISEELISQQIFETRLENLTQQAKNAFSQSASAFKDYIMSLSDDAFVYYVPEQYQGEFYYVRSILIPFSDEQSKDLERAKTLYGSDSAAYKAYRYNLAKQIEVKDYTDDDKGVETSISVLDIIDSSTFNGVSLAAVDRGTFVDWTYKYNTDGGMQNPVHSYVVSKNASTMTGSDESFVPEFVAAARSLVNGSDNATFAITDYGIHLIFNDGVVEADNISWENRFDYGIEGGSASFRFYQAIYNEVKEALLNDEIDALYKLYQDGTDSSRQLVINNNVIKGYTDTIGVKLD